MSDSVAIRVENLTKIYKLYNTPVDRLKEALSPIRRKYHHDFHALQNVSFEVKKGETMGVIGKNGSGKSTLLKMITGVLTPTSGGVSVNGKVSALLELSAGFNPELTGIENVYFNGSLMGYCREEMDNRLDNVLRFADIGEFVYQPVKTYSSGMFVRLAFAVAINVEPEILIVDEALSVGDIFFQQKCYTEIRRKIDGGTTCLFVSHDTAAVSNLCKRAILLDKGVVVIDSSTEKVVNSFISSRGKRAESSMASSYDGVVAISDELDVNESDIVNNSVLPINSSRHGAGGLLISAVRVLDKNKLDTLHVEMTHVLDFYILLQAGQEIVNPSSGIQLRDRFGNLVFAAGTRQLGLILPNLLEGQKIVVKLSLRFNVQPGEYSFSLGAAEPSAEGKNEGYFHDFCDCLGPITVHQWSGDVVPFFGIASLPLTACCSPIIEANSTVSQKL